VRIQIHVAIITYCLIAIIEHDLKIGRPVGANLMKQQRFC
jgi:hypothetical protein